MTRPEDLPPQQIEQERRFPFLRNFVALTPFSDRIEDAFEEADLSEPGVNPEPANDIEVAEQVPGEQLEEISPKLREAVAHIYDVVRQIYEKGMVYVGLTDISKVSSITFTREHYSFGNFSGNETIWTVESLQVREMTDDKMSIEISKRELLKRSDEDIKHDADRARGAWGAVKGQTGLNLPDNKPDSHYTHTHEWVKTFADGGMNVTSDGRYGRVGWADIEPDDIDAEVDPDYVSEEVHFTDGYDQAMLILDKMLSYSEGLKIDVRYPAPPLRQIDLGD